MTTAFHDVATGTDNHGPYVAKFANTAARAADAATYQATQAATGGNNPVRAIQLDNLTEWYLASIGPTVWTQILPTGDPFAQYALLAGRAGGQTLFGGTAAAENLALNSTAHATKGSVLIGSSTLVVDSANLVAAVGGAPLSTIYKFEVYDTKVAGTHQARVFNQDNTDPASNSQFRIQVGGGSAGDPALIWDITGGGNTRFYAGLDNSDSDKWMLGLGIVVGTTPYLTVDVAGKVGIGTTSPSFLFDVLSGTAGAEVCARLIHSDNTNAASNAIQRIVTGGASGGDPALFWNVNGATTFYAGLDNSDSDKWMLGLNGVVGNTAYLTVDTAGLVGIGTKIPSVNFDVVGQMGNHRYSATAGTGPGLVYFRARGTEAAPTVVLSGDRLGRFDFDGYDGAAFLAGAQVRSETTEAWAVGANGAKIVFAAVATGTTTMTDVLTVGPGNRLGFFGVAAAVRPAAYTRNAVVVESRTLLASASATTLNNNNVLAALIADLQSVGLVQ